MKIAIVLGNKLMNDGSLSSLGLDRMKILEQAQKKFNFDKIILSGGKVNKLAGHSEADAMMLWLKEHDPSIAAISIKEEKSHNTPQNAKYSVPIAIEHKADSIVVITSIEHLSRGFLRPDRLFTKELNKANSKIPLDFYSGE